MSESQSVAMLIEESLALERAGELAAALQKARQAVELAKYSGDPASQAAALNCEGYIYFRGGEFAAARRLAEEALKLAPPESIILTDILLLLGICATETDDLAGGEIYYRRAINLARLQGYDRALTRSLHNLSAGIYTPHGQFDLAIASDEEAIRIAQARGMPQATIYPRLTLTINYLRIGQLDRARAVTTELAAQVTPGSLPEGYVHYLQGELAFYDDQALDQALEAYHRARSLAESVGDPGLAIESRLGLSRGLRAAGNLAAALQWAKDAVTIASHTNGLYAYCMALVERGRVALEQHDLPTAETDLRQAIAAGERCQANFLLAHAWLLLADLLYIQSHPEARQAWQDAAHRIIDGGYAFLLEQERALAFPLVAAYLSDPNSDIAALSAALLGQLMRLSPPTLRIQLLGGLQVWQGKRPIAKQALRQRRAGELFGLLLTSPGRALTAEQAAEALSPDKPPEVAESVVHHATSELRRALEPELPDRRFPSRYLEVTDRLISLRLPPDSWLDVEAFEQAARARDWEQALALYAGDFLPEYRYAEWAIAWRERLAENFHAILFALAEARLASGNWAEALDFARRLIALDPWHEEGVMAAMRACQGLNDLSGARRYYKRLEKTLWEELGVEPQEKLQSLYRSLDKRFK